MSEERRLERVRHSLSHLMSMAVLELYPKTGLGVGPVIENGFYQDYDLPEAISEDILPKLEKRMRELIKRGIKFVQKDEDFKTAFAYYKDDSYKTELVKDLKRAGEKKVSFFDSDWYHNLCKGPHVKSTKEINPDAFKLMSIAGAYWRGSEKNKMLTRIYGVAFETKEELDEYLRLQEESEKRDHRKIGKEQDIFFFSDSVGPGLPLWLPNGTVIIDELEKLAEESERDAGYVRVRTPHLAKEEVYKTSGHLPYYADSMFPPMILEEDNGKRSVYYLKAMNCPHHHQIYASKMRSYRDLPIRLSEYGTCYRYEKGGELFGLMRVRSMQMNDAHIYCTEEQFRNEFMAVVGLYFKYFKIFGIEKYVMRLSTHSKEGLGKKYIDNQKLWLHTEKMVRGILTENSVPFVEAEDEAAFYGPKIDVQVWSAIGREFTLSTNQVDFAVPARFGLVYTNKDGEERTPVCIHRAPLSTHERLVGFLIEHYAGVWPVWLSPVQVLLAPVAAKHQHGAKAFAQELFTKDVRVEVDDADETVGNKVRKAVQRKIPYIVIIGDKELAGEPWTIRIRGPQKNRPSNGQDLQIKINKDEFAERIIKEIKERC